MWGVCLLPRVLFPHEALPAIHSSITSSNLAKHHTLGLDRLLVPTAHHSLFPRFIFFFFFFFVSAASFFCQPSLDRYVRRAKPASPPLSSPVGHLFLLPTSSLALRGLTTSKAQGFAQFSSPASSSVSSGKASHSVLIGVPALTKTSTSR